jgi:hypothetical protein
MLMYEEWLVSCPECLIPKYRSQHPLNRKLGGPKSWSGQFLIFRSFITIFPLKIKKSQDHNIK